MGDETDDNNPYGNVYLRPVNLKDARLIAEWFSDSNNIKFMSTAVRCRKHSEKGIEEEIKSSDPGYERLFMVCLAEDDSVIGHVGIDDIDLDDKRGEIFFLIGDKAHHGKGYGKAAAALLVKYAFEEMKLNSLFATATKSNVASISVLRKVGFKDIGVRRQYNFIDGEFLDEMLLDMTLQDYLDVRAKDEMGHARARPGVLGRSPSKGASDKPKTVSHMG